MQGKWGRGEDVTYIFYCIIIVYILFKKKSKILSEGKTDIGERVHKTVTP